MEAVPIAKYQEWPFQGFFKRTTIGNETAYNLEFKLPGILERLNLQNIHEALDISCRKETPAKVAILHETVARSKMYAAPLWPQIQRIRWIPEENATLHKMRKEDGCSWEEIQTALLY